MTDAENIQKLIADIFGVEKHIKNPRSTNKCIAPLNAVPLNPFARNFVCRLRRLAAQFKTDARAVNEIAEKVKNIGEAKSARWAGPYSELVALDFYSQFSEFFGLSYINLLPVQQHRESIPARNGQKEKIDIDLCLHLRDFDIFTDVKSFNCVHQNILDDVIDSVEEYALATLGKSVMIGVDNLSSIDYTDVKSHLGREKQSIYARLAKAVSADARVLRYESKSGIVFTFRIEYSDTISLVREYSPFAMAEAYKYKFLDYGSKLVDNEYSVITMVRNPWFNEETVDFGYFNNLFYRSLARRTFIELHKNENPASLYSSSYGSNAITVRNVSESIAGIVFIDDASPSAKSVPSLYSAYFYLNPNYANKAPLTIRSLEKHFRNRRERQIKDFDDFRWDNY